MTMAPEKGFTLQQRYEAMSGDVLVTGIQALARAPIDQLRADRAAGLNTRAFISGYQGSPLGGYDRELLSHQNLLDQYRVVLKPGLNEDLAATAVAGSQLVSTRPNATVDGVVGVWYGKAPGLERAGDAIRHALFAGTAPKGGVLALIGDDPACKSSTVPSRSDNLAAALGMALLDPGTMQDVLDLSRHAIELSRASGLWSGLKITTAVADGSGLADVDPNRLRIVTPQLERDGQAFVPRLTGFVMAPVSVTLEAELFGPRMEIAEKYVEVNGLNVEVVSCENAWLTIVASGYTAELVLGALSVLGLDADRASALGIRVLKLRAIHPFEQGAIRRAARGVGTMLIVEEKRAYIETLVRDALYSSAERPNVVGKRDAAGAPLITESGALTVDLLVEPLRRVLLTNISAERLAQPKQRRSAGLQLSAEATRTAYFCSGCPHNTGTVVPPNSVVGLGIGCHGLVTLVGNRDRGEFTGITQMGGEGLHWVGMSPFVETPHIFQNLGDGTFAHSGQLAIQACIAAGVTMTYKLLYNAAVAMTGGQDATGQLTVPQITHKLIAEGVKQIIVTTDDPDKYRGVALAERTTVRHRDDIVEAQEELAKIDGVTVLIHDQQCAAEKRRDRKRGLLAVPATRIVIDHRICEGCGDCGVQSNCLSLEPLDTEYGRKTKIDQASCNLDTSCLKGDCPAFVSVVPSKQTGSRQSATDPLSLGALPEPQRKVPSDGMTIRMPGVGGTGVVTVSQMLLAAAKIDGFEASALDQTGLSQKAGPVVSTVSIGNPVPGQIDVLLGFDLITSVSGYNMDGLDPSTTWVVASSNITPTGRMIGKVASASLDTTPMREALDARSKGAGENLYPNSAKLTTGLLGNALTANSLLLGVAYQAGLIPMSAAAIEQAIELNGTAVAANQAAFRWGRRWVVDRSGVEARAFAIDETPVDRKGLDGLGSDELVDLVARRRRDLVTYQDKKYADRYVEVVRRAASAEAAAGGDGAFARVVAEQLYRVMAYKDEYEVARLMLDGRERVEWAFGAPVDSVTWHLHPPALRDRGLIKKKIEVGEWSRPGLKSLASMKRLRGTKADPFGRTEMRRTERRVIDDYTRLVTDRLLPMLTTEHARAVQVAGLIDQVRGFEDVKMRNLAAYEKALLDALG